MNITEIMTKLKQRKIKTTNKEISKLWGITEQTFCRKRKAKDEIDYTNIKTLEKYFNIVLTDDVMHLASIVGTSEQNNNNTFINNECACGEQFDVPYWEGLPNNLKRPKISSIHTDIELIENDWQLKSEIIRIIPMKGDCLQNYWYPMRHNDILAFDITNKDLNNDGIFVFTTNEGENIYIRKLNLLMDGNINVMDYTNHEPQIVKTITPEKAKEVNFKIIGRVFKNISLRI